MQNFVKNLLGFACFVAKAYIKRMRYATFAKLFAFVKDAYKAVGAIKKLDVGASRIEI